MPQAVKSDLLLCDPCLMHTGKDIKMIEEQLNTDLSLLCDWFIDNKLSVHFGEEKTKSILFGNKRQLKNQRDLVLGYGNIESKQCSKVTYLGCILDNDLSGESMATKVLSLVNSRLKFLCRKQQKFLTLPYVVYCAMLWFNRTTTMLVLLGTHLWTKDCRRRSKHLKINVSDIVWT